MKNETVDRRILRTKRLIQDSLAELMKEKRFEKITVKDITEKANINRSTFYLHYYDKYDLLDSSMDEIIAEIEQRGHEIVHAELNNSSIQCVAYKNQELLEYIFNSSPLIKVLMSTNGSLYFQVKLKNMIQKSFDLQLKQKKGNCSTEYISAYIASAHFGILQQWIESGMKESPKEIAMLVAKTTIYGPLQVD